MRRAPSCDRSGHAIDRAEDTTARAPTYTWEVMRTERSGMRKSAGATCGDVMHPGLVWRRGRHAMPVHSVLEFFQMRAMTLLLSCCGPCVEKSCGCRYS